MICDRCIHKKVCKIEYDIHNCADFFELVRCKDCKHSIKYVSFYLCFKSVGGVAKKADEFCNCGERKEKENDEKKNGRWINHTEYGVTTYISDKDVECSECGHRQPELFDMKFCPNCGAVMRGKTK